MKHLLHNILNELHKVEQRISLETSTSIDEAYQIRTYLKELLLNLKKQILEKGFSDNDEEIYFFRNVKPQVLGKLIYYNKVYSIETACPVDNGKMYFNYFSVHLKILKQEYAEHICNSDFYRYYRSGRTDKDEEYFKLGKINYYDSLSSYVFEIDSQFSTYYDYKVARIISNELLYNYLLTKINPNENPDMILQKPENSKDIFWTDSKNALIELIYALYAAGVISHGKISIRKISIIFQILFRIPLSDLHHAFHRMKTRSGSRTAFLDQLKISLEEYMDKDL
ncbi:tetracycline regulation of excision, RteC [Flavobacterium columnare]|uniref:RteC domain-containing protein n=1 Tax=Flavobacterium TaxID=237 RepID=UPI001896693F|nr:RteC domain-containing protein [Flavobacterium columnare]MBF6652950.1 tetracycline regulation of excision, RteC [Flavobacterium columnare]MBF6657544.1 tetracycline regulation of excision, RteC [Flavobacterium columnare]